MTTVNARRVLCVQTGLDMLLFAAVTRRRRQGLLRIERVA